LKDLIIIRGRNLYPQDIERTVERSHPSLRIGSGAAFTVEVDNEERLVVVQELEFRAKPNLDDVTATIRQAVTQEYEVQAYAVVLIKPGSIPKTSSGKIQRRACRAKFLDGTLNVKRISRLETTDIIENGNKLTREVLLASPQKKRQQRLEFYLQEQVARVLRVVSTQINFNQPLSSVGLDSLMVFDLKNRIEIDLNIEISVTDLFEGTTLVQLAGQILNQLNGEATLHSKPYPLPRTGDFPLSYAQQRLWFFDQLKPGCSLYNIPIALQLKGSLNVAALEQSVQEILRRHEALRTTFRTVEGKPVQVIASNLSLTLPVVDLQDLPPPQQQETVQQLIAADIQQPFDLKTAPLLRTKLLKLAQNDHILLLVMHHIVTDGWSMGVFIEELTTLYQAFSTQQSSPLPELPIQYADFAVWQRQYLKGEKIETQLAYWRQQLEGKQPALEFPTDYPRPPVQSFRGARQSFAVSKMLSDALKRLSQQEGVTLFMTLLAAFKAVLHNYTNQDDLIVGTDVANRTQYETQKLIGFFVNQLVLRTNLSGNPPFREVLRRVRQVTVGAYAHHELPFDKLIEALNPERDLSRAPLFQVKVVLQNSPLPPLALSGLTLNRLDVNPGAAMLDLFLSLEDTEAGLSGFLEYDIELFRATTIQRLLVDFKTVLSHVSVHPNTTISELQTVLAEVEQQQQVQDDKTLAALSLQKLAQFRQKTVR
jgi:NRPS condensation-like uncharacterized protein/acyl carrier protein